MNSDIAVTRTYSLTMQHIAMVKEMAVCLSTEDKKMGDSEVVRLAIDMLYDSASAKLARETHPGPTENLVAELRSQLVSEPE